MALIKNKQVVTDDTWIEVADDRPVPHSGNVIVSLKRIQADPGLVSRGASLGVRLEPEDEVSDAVPLLAKVGLVAVNFPKFGDGRGFTKARLLRERYGYQGELRAVGEVLADRLFYMKRCGIDAFALAPGKDVAAALRCLEDFSVTYQAATDDPLPLYRRVNRG